MFKTRVIYTLKLIKTPPVLFDTKVEIFLVPVDMNKKNT